MDKKYLELRDKIANNSSDTFNMFIRKGFDAAIEAMEKEMKVININKFTCCGCFFYEKIAVTCLLYDQEIKTATVCKEPIKPDFCLAKKVKILIETEREA
jgi:hypothetical protein